MIRNGRTRVGAASDHRRRALRRVAAALSAACAVIYVLIGVGVLPVAAGDAAPGMLVFGALAASAFGLGAVLLVTTDRRIFWILGAVFQAFTIVTYFQVAEQRDPPFETWGLVLKVFQSIILASLLALVILDRRPDDPGREPRG